MIGRQRKHSRSTKICLQLESLESRRLMAANVWRGTLTVSGSPGNDTLVVRRSADDSRMIEVIENGQRTSSFPVSSVRSIRIDGGHGDDVIRVDQANGRIALPAMLFGGAGDDEFVAAAGINRIDGGTGRNVYESGGGRDFVARASLADSLQRFSSTEAFCRYMISAAAKRHTFGGLLDENGNATRPLASRAAGLESAGVPQDAVYGSTDLRTTYAEPLNPEAPASLANPWILKLTGDPPADAVPVADSPSTLRDANGTLYTSTASTYFRPNPQRDVEYKILAVDNVRLFGFRNGEIFVAPVSTPQDSQWRQPVAGAPVASYLHPGRLSLVTEVSEAPVAGSSIAMQPLRDRTGKQVVVSVFDVAGDAAPRLVSSTRIDGAYSDSHFIDGRLTLVVRNDLLAGYWKGITDPHSPVPDSPVQSNPEAATPISNGALVNLVRRMPVDAMLPTWRTAVATDTTEMTTGSGMLSRAEDIRCPGIGIEPELISLVTIDVTAASPTVAGVTSSMAKYATTTFLTGSDIYVFSPQWRSSNGDQTILQRFRLANSAPRVVATGLVDGHLASPPVAMPSDGSIKAIFVTKFFAGPTSTNSLGNAPGAPSPRILSGGRFSREQLTLTLQQGTSSSWLGGTGGTGGGIGGNAFVNNTGASLYSTSAGDVLGISDTRLVPLPRTTDVINGIKMAGFGAAIESLAPPPDALYALATLQTRGGRLQAASRSEWAGRSDAVVSIAITGNTTHVISIQPTAAQFFSSSVCPGFYSESPFEAIGDEPRLPSYAIVLQPLEDDFLIGIAKERNSANGQASGLRLTLFDNPLGGSPEPMTTLRIRSPAGEAAWSEHMWNSYAQHVAMFLGVGVRNEPSVVSSNAALGLSWVAEGPATVMYEIRVSHVSPTSGPT